MVTRRDTFILTSAALLLTVLIASISVGSPGALLSPSSPPSESEIRVVCWVVTTPKYHKTRASTAKETWIRHCDDHFFVSTRQDKLLNPLVVNVVENYWTLWGKTRAGLRHLYLNYLESSHWFIKADDDTFVIVENLKHMLRLYDHRQPIYFGNKFKEKNISQGFMGGGAGYVMSREAVKRVVEEGFPNKKTCSQGPRGREDVELGKCLEAVGVVAGDSRDHLGRDRFMTFTPDVLQTPGGVDAKGHSWFWDLVYYDTNEGSMCCSDTAITFHYVKPEMMRALYYLVYVFRLARPQDPLPRQPPESSDVSLA